MKMEPIKQNELKHNVEMEPSIAEIHLLRRLRNLQGADYEFQNLVVNPIPRNDTFSRMGNPTTLGISVFVVTNTMIAVFMLQVRGIQHTDVLVGMLWFTGGVASWLTAIFELFLGNTFAWTVFGSFGGYYFAYASISTPSFQIGVGYPAEQLQQQLGVFHCCWAALFIIFLIMSLRTNAVFVFIFTTVDVTSWLLAASHFQTAAGNTETALRLTQIAGGFLLACTVGGWYLLTYQLAEGLGLSLKMPIGSLVRTVVKDEERTTR